ncbi:MAG: DNA polymerase III subunit alpha, partial [Acetatifactor sp.]|nr:DNA polymerase III subunit alpha [Acetatifactor sp.]
QVMQIVRDLAGYSYGRSDLVRRAMSKKKASVMEKERQNFIYGNKEENVPGCIARGISEKIANQIFDEMTDFAKYAFNKSHAAAYAVVAYQTAFLKYYYPVEFMAALMTSVIDFPNKVSEYIYHCRQMGIEILPPDINEGFADFSVTGTNIRYGMAAIKGLGRPVIETIVEEREKNGAFSHMKDMATRLSGKEMNKRTFESLIKAGALDSLPGTRRQKMSIYAQLLEGVNQERKNNFAGQLSLFDFATEETKAEYDITFPNVGEYEKGQLLSFEKEVLGIYISGHPLEEYEGMWKKNITHSTLDFTLDEEGNVKVKDGAIETIGGMIAGKTIKTTRTNSQMAFLTLEDLVGTVEVIVFPRDYENYRSLLTEERKVFIRGKVTSEEEKDAKLICQKIIPFEDVPRELWIRFPNKNEFVENEQKLYDLLSDCDGKDVICIYLEEEKAIKRLPKSRSCEANRELMAKLSEIFGEKNVRLKEMSIEKNV